ncbi:MAG TPA: alpha/beta hydrolase [Hyphomicrobiaceae bacterium]|nr:alpha/beta hydrolase [Hyphomicrobiaceae bacterium]
MELVAIARNPVPSGAVVGTFRGYDGAPLRYACFAATRGPRRGTMCIFSGRTEFIEKYFEVIADLRRRGFAVAIMDWRGQGGSYRPLADRHKGHIRDFSEYDRDLACFMRDIVLPDCPPPYLALAHSMGGNILLRNAGTPGTWFERMVLVAPMIKLHPSQLGLPQGLVRAYAETCSSIGLARSYTAGSSSAPYELSSFENNVLTSDRERYTRNRMLSEAAPHLVLGGPTVGWLRAALRSMAMLNDPSYARRISIPLMFFIAGRDTVVEPRAIEDFASRLKVGTHVILANAKHEILQETDDIRGRFWAAFDSYMGVAAAA